MGCDRCVEGVGLHSTSSTSCEGVKMCPTSRTGIGGVGGYTDGVYENRSGESVGGAGSEMMVLVGGGGGGGGDDGGGSIRPWGGGVEKGAGCLVRSAWRILRRFASSVCVERREGCILLSPIVVKMEGGGGGERRRRERHPLSCDDGRNVKCI